MAEFGAAVAMTAAVGCGGASAGTSPSDASTFDAQAIDSPADQTVDVDMTIDSGSEASVCADGQTECNGACVTLSSDGNNCGECGAQCGAGLVCSQGVCAVSCGAAAATLCGTSCAILASDPEHCGSCGISCAPGYACMNGQCAAVCSGGTTACGAVCVNTKTDPANCGGCGKPCSGGTVCVAGQCAVVCPGSEINCGGTCIDPATSNAFCGASGSCTGATAGVKCPSGTVCSPSDAGPPSCQTTCGNGLVLCPGGSRCSDPSIDPLNCGRCGNQCGPDNTCVAGRCTQTHVLGGADLVGQQQDANVCNAFINGIDQAGTLSCAGNDVTNDDYGFEWTDNGDLSAQPTKLTLTFSQGYSCDPTSLHDVQLNGVTVATFLDGNTPTSKYESMGTCACPSTTATTTLTITDTAALSSYQANATNVFTIVVPSTAPNNFCEGMSPITGDTFANVTVTY